MGRHRGSRTKDPRDFTQVVRTARERLQFVRDVKSKGDLSFIHFNARSLNKNFQTNKDSIDDLKLSFDILAISETWAETYTIDGFTLNGYEAFHIVRGQRKGRGVALYVQ